VLVEAYPRLRTYQEAFKCGLLYQELIPPQIVSIQLNQVERPHEHIRVVAPVSDPIRVGDPIRAA
jgi:hypothetical protein